MLSTFAELSGLSTQFLPPGFACCLTIELVLHLFYLIPLYFPLLKLAGHETFGIFSVSG